MEKILIMDAKNYDTNLEEIYRVAVRGIIFIDGKLLMIEDNFGEVKLPGGGIDPNEDDYQASSWRLWNYSLWLMLFASLKHSRIQESSDDQEGLCLQQLSVFSEILACFFIS